MVSRIEAAGVELDFSRMLISVDPAEEYKERIDAAVAEMAAIEAGERVNRDEDRQVGHYWLRNPDIAPTDAAAAIRESLEKIRSFSMDGENHQFRNILWIGIGGSGLGPQLLHDALRVPGRTPGMYFFDNTDPFGFQRTLADIEQAGGLQSTLTIVVSKSGGTKETANGMKVAMAAYEQAGLTFSEHAAAVTQPGSALDQLAESWLTRFAIWDWVGGRTSVFSAVGLVPSALLGFDVDALLAGAREMDEATRHDSFESNAALQLAAVWYHTVETLQRKNMVVLPYCDRVSLIAKYLQQLVMESLGKDGRGISVFGNKGATDQHSYVQQLRDGCDDFFVMFLRVLDPEADKWEVEPGITAGDYLMAFQEGTAKALTDAGRPSLRITVDRLNERSLGALIALFERTVGYCGAMLGINSYHQPGVEAGKVAAGDLLKAQQFLQSHLDAAPADLRDAEQMQEYAATLRQSGGPEELTPEFAADLLRRLAVCQRLPKLGE